MKKRLTLLIGILLTAALLAACGTAPAQASAETETPVAATPVPTTPPDTAQTPDPAQTELGEDAMALTHGDSTYYLDINDAAVLDFNEDPPLKVRKSDGTVQDMGIRGFQYDIIGDYIYVNTNDPDLDDTGTQTWSTTRMNLDGSGKVKLEYPSMSERFAPEGETSFYFTTLGDCAIFASDYACENVRVLPVALPDKTDLDKKIGTDNVLQLTINDIKDGVIDFDVTLSTKDGIARYNGNYRIGEDGSNITKVKGTYYSYGSQENE